MFLKTVTELSTDFEEVRAALVRRPRGWLEELASAAGAEGSRLLVQVGLEVHGRQLVRRARIEVGDPITTDRLASLPLRLWMEDHEHLFPTLEGSIDAAWLGPGCTHLALTAQYRPPFGVLGQVIDRALLHRVAEAVAQQFLEAVAVRLSGRQPVSNGQRRA